MRGDDFEPFRGQWVARSEADDAVVAAADSLEELDALLDQLGAPKVVVHRVPRADEPLFIDLG